MKPQPIDKFLCK